MFGRSDVLLLTLKRPNAPRLEVNRADGKTLRSLKHTEAVDVEVYMSKR